MLKKSLIVLIIVTGIAYAYLLWPWITPWLLSKAQVSLAADPIPDNTNSPAVVVNAMITPPPRFQETELTLTAAPNAIGWATDLGGRGYLAEPEIMAGSFDGNTFMGALQFDLSAVPAGAMITYADLQLTGRNGQSLQPNGKWELQLLASAVDAAWATLNYNALHQAAIETTVGQPLTSADLAEGQANSFRFDAMQLRLLQSHLNNGVVSFRLTGPATTAGDNIFTWRGVVDGSTAENQPQLHLRFTPGDDVGPRTGSVAVDTLPPDFIAKVSTPTVTSQPATSTPLPENIITVTAETAPATEMAAAIDIFTPVPETRSTPTSPTPTSTATPSPTTLAAVLVTRTPTPENVITMAAQAAQATAIATAVGTYTPEPRNWVFPVVVTPEPAPVNQATATFRVAAATAEAFLSGATPRYVWTATPTPFMKSVTGDVATPWAATPTPTPPSIPQQLVGKIAFLSNRSGGPEPLRNPLVYVVDPDGSSLAVLTEDTFYKLAEQRDMLSADQRFRTFVKEFPRYIGESGQHQMVPAIFFYDYEYNAEEQITFFGAGDAWDPVWSPGREQIAFVSNDSQDDEIWIVNRDGSGLRRLTETNEGFNAREIGKDTFVPEINGHPSWSPDGNQIVFTSTRSGHRQIWVMDADGSNLFSLSTTGYDDWNPVWIKYTDRLD